jgi:hypothetical protein
MSGGCLLNLKPTNVKKVKRIDTITEVVKAPSDKIKNNLYL